jgi:putative endonuclease
MYSYYVYIMTNTNLGLYIGVTDNICRRVKEHKEEIQDGFTKKYHMHRLIYYETFQDIHSAIRREKRLKWWPRKWKVKLITANNPDWKDLAADWYEPELQPK